MAQHNVQDIRNIALCGHGSAGKTTLADALLNAMREPLRQALEGNLTAKQAAEMMQANAKR